MPWNPLNEEGRIALIVSGQVHEECSVMFTERGHWQPTTMPGAPMACSTLSRRSRLFEIMLSST
jgi:hypothetical protein